MKTVYRSLVWGLQTTRHNEHHNERLASCQRMMVRKLMGLKRFPIWHEGKKIGCEPWVDWQIRSLRRAATEISKRNLTIGHLVDAERVAWAGHVSCFGNFPNSVTHISKYLAGWRSRFWWESQKLYNALNWEVLKHEWPFKPQRWEDSLPMDWVIRFSKQDREPQNVNVAVWDPYLGKIA